MHVLRQRLGHQLHRPLHHHLLHVLLVCREQRQGVEGAPLQVRVLLVRPHAEQDGLDAADLHDRVGQLFRCKLADEVQGNERVPLVGLGVSRNTSLLKLSREGKQKQRQEKGNRQVGGRSQE